MPTLLNLADTVPQDTGDPLLQAWQVAWTGHALRSNPESIWQGNAFYPARDTLAFSDSLLGYAPAGVLGSGPVVAVVRYNLLFIVAHALACAGGYALARQLGASWQGAALTGVVFAFAPWRLAHAGHLNILSTGGIALSLALLARGSGLSLRPNWNPKRVSASFVIAGWLVAAWQMTLGFGLGLAFATVLAITVISICITTFFGRLRWLVQRNLVTAHLVGGSVFASVSIGMALPHLRAAAANPGFRRTLQDIEMFSPPPRGLLTAPDKSLVWGDVGEQYRQAMAAPAEMTLFVGATVLILAGVGVVYSAWTRGARFFLAVVVIISILLTLGTEAPGQGRYSYLLLFHHSPGWEGIRTPSRWIVWTTLLLGILAAGAVTRVCDRFQNEHTAATTIRRRVGVAAILSVPALLATIEGLNNTPHPTVPRAPVRMSALDSPVLLLPTDVLADQRDMFFSTDGFPTLVNGGSGFMPRTNYEMRDRTKNFPDIGSIRYLRKIGVRTVIVHPNPPQNTAYRRAQDAISSELGITRHRVGDTYLFTLEPPQ